jgi:hypothetical protein
MEDIDADGLFWLPGNEDNAVAGRFRFSQDGGPALSLIGAFSRLEETFREDLGDWTPRIFGVAGKKLLTLDGCMRTSWGIEMPGIRRETWVCDRVLAGKHWGADEEPLLCQRRAAGARHGRTNMNQQWLRPREGGTHCAEPPPSVQPAARPDPSAQDRLLSARHPTRAVRGLSTPSAPPLT